MNQAQSLDLCIPDSSHEVASTWAMLCRDGFTAWQDIFSGATIKPGATIKSIAGHYG